MKSKRQFLKGLAALMGTSVVAQLTSGNALASAFAYQPKLNSANQTGKIFNQKQMQILANICEVVLPKTDTPSAAELDVHGFMDHQLFTCFSKTQQAQSIMILDRIDQQSHSLFSKSYSQLSFDQQTQLLVSLESVKIGFTLVDKEYFQTLKSLLVFGYFTTEVGATQVLSYQAIPGGFKGSIPYDSVGKSYGSLGFY